MEWIYVLPQDTEEVKYGKENLILNSCSVAVKLRHLLSILSFYIYSWWVNEALKCWFHCHLSQWNLLGYIQNCWKKKLFSKNTWPWIVHKTLVCMALYTLLTFVNFFSFFISMLIFTSKLRHFVCFKELYLIAWFVLKKQPFILCNVNLFRSASSLNGPVDRAVHLSGFVSDVISCGFF